MNQPVLILASAADVHAAAACWALGRAAVETVVSTDGSLAAASVGATSLRVGPDEPLAWRTADGSGFRSVWHRRVREPDRVAGLGDCDQAFAVDEWALFQRNLLAADWALPGALWVNRPDAARRAENKAIQLDAARRCGLRVPRTLFSSDPDAVEAFRQANRRVIYKPFSLHTWLSDARDRACVVHARLLEPEFHVDPRAVQACPGIFQAYVEKTADIRVTVVGEHMSAVRIADRSGDAFVDWRSHVRAEGFEPTECMLPAPTEDKLRALMKSLGLAYGAIDLVLDAEGHLHFLEVNQAGQFLFVERWLPRIPLLSLFCSMLAAGRTDYSRSNAPATYADFLASDFHFEWRRKLEDDPGIAVVGGALPSVEPAEYGLA